MYSEPVYRVGKGGRKVKLQYTNEQHQAWHAQASEQSRNDHPTIAKRLDGQASKKDPVGAHVFMGELGALYKQRTQMEAKGLEDEETIVKLFETVEDLRQQLINEREKSKATLKASELASHHMYLYYQELAENTLNTNVLTYNQHRQACLAGYESNEQLHKQVTRDFVDTIDKISRGQKNTDAWMRIVSIAMLQNKKAAS